MTRPAAEFWDSLNFNALRRTWDQNAKIALWLVQQFVKLENTPAGDFNPSEKYVFVKLEIFPNFSGWKMKKYVSCHHLDWLCNYLVGGFNPSEKYARQIGSFSQVGLEIKICELPPPSYEHIPYFSPFSDTKNPPVGRLLLPPRFEDRWMAWYSAGVAARPRGSSSVWLELIG